MAWQRVSTRQGDFWFDGRDRHIGGVLRANGRYGDHEIRAALSYMTPTSRVLVIGAHIGAVAIPLSPHCLELVAIEPNPDTYALLAANLTLNNCRNVTCHQVAANHCSETLQFVCNTTNSGGSKRMPLVRDPGFFRDDPEIVPVQGVALDALLPGSFEVIFMDCEGSEVFAFRGMPRILAGARTLLVEFLPHHLTQVAGVTVEEFVAPLKHFSRLHVPSMGWFDRPFETPLQDMFDRGVGEPVIVFAH